MFDYHRNYLSDCHLENWDDINSNTFNQYLYNNHFITSLAYMNNFLSPFFSQENTSSKPLLHTILCYISLSLASLYTDSPLNLVFCKQHMSSDICSSIWAGFLNQRLSAPTFTLNAFKCTNFLFRWCSDNVTLLLLYMASSLWKVPILLIEMWQNFQRSCNWCSGKTSYKLLETDLLLVKSLKSVYL